METNRKKISHRKKLMLLKTQLPTPKKLFSHKEHKGHQEQK